MRSSIENDLAKAPVKEWILFPPAKAGGNSKCKSKNWNFMKWVVALAESNLAKAPVKEWILFPHAKAGGNSGGKSSE